MTDGWPELVRAKRAQVRSALRTQLQSLGLPDGTVPLLADAGQVNRGVLTVLVSEAIDATRAGDTAATMPLAVAIELIHRTSVIHDDIQDHDRIRRGLPTFHLSVGVPVALAVADVLMSTAFGLLSATGDDGVLADTISTYRRMARGQLMDIAGPTDAAGPHWAYPAELKTGSLVALAFAYGARAGGAPEATVREWSLVGQLCGTAFQLINDVRNARDQEDRGAAPASDLVHGRFSAIRLYAEQVLNTGPNLQPDQIEAACEAVEGEARARLREATETIHRIGPEGFAASILTVLTAPAAASVFVLQDPTRDPAG